MSAPERDSLPDGPLVTWYGDDFTGAAAVMEVLTFAGLPAVLFLDIPDEKRLTRFAGYRGIGIAGAARSQSPIWMDENLPPVFAALQRIGAPVSHYKICSTLDSSPSVGSIGKAIELALPVLGGAWHRRVGTMDCSIAPLTEPDMRTTHPALWIGPSKCQLKLGRYLRGVKFLPSGLQRYQSSCEPGNRIGPRHARTVGLVPDTPAAIRGAGGSPAARPPLPKDAGEGSGVASSDAR